MTDETKDTDYRQRSIDRKMAQREAELKAGPQPRPKPAPPKTLKTKWGHVIEPPPADVGGVQQPRVTLPPPRKTPAFFRRILDDIRRFGTQSDGMFYLWIDGNASWQSNAQLPEREIVQMLKDAFFTSKPYPIAQAPALNHLSPPKVEPPRTKENMPDWVKDLPDWQQQRWLDYKGLEGFDPDSTEDAMKDSDFWGKDALTN